MDVATLRRAGLTLLVSAILGSSLAVAAWSFSSAFAPSAGIVTQATALFVLIVSGAALYFALAQVSGAAELGELARNLRRRAAAS
jgi:hypothetical protein